MKRECYPPVSLSACRCLINEKLSYRTGPKHDRSSTHGCKAHERHSKNTGYNDHASQLCSTYSLGPEHFWAPLPFSAPAGEERFKTGAFCCELGPWLLARTAENRNKNQYLIRVTPTSLTEGLDTGGLGTAGAEFLRDMVFEKVSVPL